ncbi:MAG: hypothetical protein HFG16_03140 [Erysipelotrichaceae bacterium]|jgi:hypothetical protein|nr:hypothetical protein [Erysipelotrichaceae bacterium]
MIHKQSYDDFGYAKRTVNMLLTAIDGYSIKEKKTYVYRKRDKSSKRYVNGGTPKMKKERYLIVLIAGIIILLGWVAYKESVEREAAKTHIEEEVVLNDIPIKVSIVYENKELIIKPSPEDRYRCLITYNAKIDKKAFDIELSLLSDKNPIELTNIYIDEDYQDDKIIIYDIQIEYYLNGDVMDGRNILNIENYVYLKKENKCINFQMWYDDLINILQKEGYTEYSEEKIQEITDENYERWYNQDMKRKNR